MDSDKKFLQNCFFTFDITNKGFIKKQEIIDLFLKRGFAMNNPYATGIAKGLKEVSREEKIDLKKFLQITSGQVAVMKKIMSDQMIIPNFHLFRSNIEAVFKDVSLNTGGETAQYIPQLANVDPEQFGLSICTVDNQKASFGDSEVPFCVQSTCKPINYCVAMELNGADYVHKHVGREPSGRSFNEIALNKVNLPHNPLINSGAIMSSSLIHSDKDLATRFENISHFWRELSGGVRPGFNNSVYHSEKDTADRNFALAHHMREMKAFPENTNIRETLDFYFQCCSIEITAESMAMVAATLANSGVCPSTGKRIFSSETVKNCLSLMYSCGMYDFSGEFAFKVGLPAKSGVSGALMIIVPNVMGIAVWSPRLDEIGNSVRGVDFAIKLSEKYSLHVYDDITTMGGKKINPVKNESHEYNNLVFNFISAASEGNLNEVKRILSLELDVNAADYDNRTALHLAAEENQKEVVEYLIAHGAKTDIKDRFGNTPKV